LIGVIWVRLNGGNGKKLRFIQLLAYLYIKDIMGRFPTTENTEIFTMRISPQLKKKLNELAKRSKYGGSASSAIRVLIEKASKGIF